MVYFINRSKKTNWIKFKDNDYRLTKDNKQFTTIYRLNNSAFHIWTLLNGNINYNTLKKKLENKYHINHISISSLIKTLKEFELIHFSKNSFKSINVNLYYNFHSLHNFDKPKIELLKRFKKNRYTRKKLWPFIYNNRTVTRFFKPNHFSIDLTYKCNLSCKHCYIEQKDMCVETDKEKICAMIDLAKELNIQDINFIGGEPFVLDELSNYIKYAFNNNMKVWILTNGTINIEKNLDLLKKCGVVLSFSLDGSNSRSHDFIRGKNTFKKTVLSIKQAVLKGIEVQIIYTLYKRNLFDVPKAYSLAKKLGVKIFHMQLFKCIGNGKINKVDLELGLFGKCVMYTYYYLYSFLNIFEKKTIFDTPLDSGCNVRDYIKLKPSGDVTYCSQFPKEVTFWNIFKDDFLSKWNSKEQLELFDKTKIKEPCKSCLFKKNCGMGCRAEIYANTGDFFAGNIFCFRGKISAKLNYFLKLFQKKV